MKTKMVWVGSKKISKYVFHYSRWKLTRNNTTFDPLGIKFSVNLHEMPELNYKSKLLEIEQITNGNQENQLQLEKYLY